MARVFASFLLVLAIIFVVPFVVYGLVSTNADLEPPGGSPILFLTGVFVSKVGTAIAFVWIFSVAKGFLDGRWLLYAAIWWVMYVFGEVGQAIGPGYTWWEAIAGMVSETIYFPLSAYVTNRILNGTRPART